MKKKLIGKWNGYNVYYHGKEKWTIESKNKVHNEINSKENFGHWVFHSGFIPDGAVK